MKKIQKQQVIDLIKTNEQTIKGMFENKRYVHIESLMEILSIDNNSISPLMKIVIYFSNYIGIRKTSKCYISVKSIAEKLDINRSYCNEIITCLIESGIIHRAGIPRSKLRREWHLGENVNCNQCNPFLLQSLLEYSEKQAQVCEKIEEVIEASKDKVEVFEEVLKVPEVVEVDIEAVEVASNVNDWDTAAQYREKTPETFSDYKEQTYPITGNTWNKLTKKSLTKLGSSEKLTVKSAIKIWLSALNSIGMPYKERYQEHSITQKLTGDITSYTETDFTEACFVFLEKKKNQKLKWLNDRDLYTSKPINDMFANRTNSTGWPSADNLTGLSTSNDNVTNFIMKEGIYKQNAI